MTAVSSAQSKDKYEFSMEKPTQSAGKKILIHQSSQGLSISVSENGVVWPIEKDMIDGLPKKGMIPKDFFDQCYCSLRDCKTEYEKIPGVSFKLPIKGGVISASAVATFAMPVLQEILNSIRNANNSKKERDAFCYNWIREMQDKINENGGGAYCAVYNMDDGKFTNGLQGVLWERRQVVGGTAFQMVVFTHGQLINAGDGGYCNWGYTGGTREKIVVKHFAMSKYRNEYYGEGVKVTWAPPQPPPVTFHMYARGHGYGTGQAPSGSQNCAQQ